MKNTIKITLAFALFTGTLMADGQMGSGGCNGENCPPPPPPCTENCGRPVEAAIEPLTTKIARGLIRIYFMRF